MGNELLKKAMAIGALLLAGSIAYFFVFALPKHNAAKLQFERQKYEEEKAYKESRDREQQLEKAEKEGQAEFDKLLDDCLFRADETAENYVMLNGGVKTDKGTITAASRLWDEAEKKKKAAKDECYRKYKQ